MYIIDIVYIYKNKIMDSENYRQILNNEYNLQKLTQEDFNNTLMHFAKLYCKEKLILTGVVGQSEQLLCPVCDSKKTYEDRTHVCCVYCNYKHKLIAYNVNRV